MPVPKRVFLYKIGVAQAFHNLFTNMDCTNLGVVRVYLIESTLTKSIGCVGSVVVAIEFSKKPRIYVSSSGQFSTFAIAGCGVFATKELRREETTLDICKWGRDAETVGVKHNGEGAPGVLADTGTGEMGSTRSMKRCAIILNVGGNCFLASPWPIGVNVLDGTWEGMD